jgi:hypothetical protein
MHGGGWHLVLTLVSASSMFIGVGNSTMVGAGGLFD